MGKPLPGWTSVKSFSAIGAQIESVQITVSRPSASGLFLEAGREKCSPPRQRDYALASEAAAADCRRRIAAVVRIEQAGARARLPVAPPMLKLLQAPFDLSFNAGDDGFTFSRGSSARLAIDSDAWLSVSDVQLARPLGRVPAAAWVNR